MSNQNSNIVVKVENLSKLYRLGIIGSTTLRHDLQSMWARFRGKEDPNTPISQSLRDIAQNADQTFWALKDLNFTLSQGEITGVIGKNGAGKSTLLKIMSRITLPTGGCIKLRGRVASLLEVGTGFHPELTGAENIFLNGVILGMTRVEIRKRYNDIVAFSEIERFIDTPIKRYSSGMQVRLAFSVAVHLDPNILIIDEVLSVGDDAFQRKCISKVKEIASSGKTVIFVTHSKDVVLNLCQRAIWLENGRIKMDATPKTVISNYLKEFSSSSRKKKSSQKKKLR